MAGAVFQDLNVRDPFVSSSTEFLLYDTKVVVQSVWRLLTTEEGEIPNFRVYGLGIKKYQQYPLTDSTVSIIFNHIKSKLTTFETRAKIAKTEVDVIIETGRIGYDFWLQVISTGQSVKLPTFYVQVAS